MKVIIDTNVLLTSLKRSSKYRPIFDHLLKRSYHLVVTNEILTEYIEIIGSRTKPGIASNLADLLTRLENVNKIEVHYNWLLITADPDDNKYVDAAVAGNVDYIVTHDNHFKVLKMIDFPKVEVISGEAFIGLLESL